MARAKNKLTSTQCTASERGKDMKLRAVYHVRTSDRDYASETELEAEYDRMAAILAKTVADNASEGILTVGVNWYHDVASCPGHAEYEECNP
jgi:hypothetical protein